MDIKITITGGHSSGKTTIAAAVVQALRSHGIEVEHLGETGFDGRHAIHYPPMAWHHDGRTMAVLVERGCKVAVVEQQAPRGGIGVTVTHSPKKAP